MNKPTFSLSTTLEIERYNSSLKYKMVPACKVDATELNLQDICQICNEELVYKWLFSPSKYTIDEAKEFMDWAKEGWKHKTHFVFFIVTQRDSVVGAFDIKSDELEASEIGYWISSSHNGLASNALKLLIQVARDAGYSLLYAQTKAGNGRSIKVLERNGFKRDLNYLKNSSCSDAFSLKI